MAEASRHPRVFYVIVPIASVVLTLLLLELFLRLLVPQPHAIETNAYYVADPSLGFRMMPESVGSYFGRIPLEVNAYGHRDDWVPIEKPKGTKRILVLGDSFTIGAGVGQDEAYPQVLEGLLRRRDPAIDVINAGVGGWEPFQYAEYLETEGVAFEPDLVIVGFFVGNDAYDQTSRPEEVSRTAVGGRRVLRDSADRPLAASLVFLYQHSHLARLILRARSGEGVFEDPAYERSICDGLSDWLVAGQRFYLSNHLPEADDTRALMRTSLAQIQRIADITSGAAIPMLVLLIPDMNQISPLVQERILGPGERQQFDPEMPQRALARELALRGIPFLDLRETFEGRECLFTNNSHFDAEGHRLVAAAVESYLVRTPVRPSDAVEGVFWAWALER